jgi:hypothetical protein
MLALKRILFPVERLVVLFTIFVAVLYSIFSIAPRTRADFYIKQVFMAIDNYALGLAIAAIFVFGHEILLKKQPKTWAQFAAAWKRYIELFLTRVRLIEDLRLLFAMLLTLALFTHLKHLIPRINPIVFDSWLLDFELILFDRSLSEILVTNLGSAWAPFLSWCYTAYFVYMNTIVVLFIVQRNRLLKHQFITAFSLLWFVGTLMIYAAPTWGPCFYLPEIFTSLPQTDVAVIQREFWVQKLALDRNPNHPFAIFYISGQPSLHIAITTLGSIFLMKLWKPLGYLSWIFVALTWLTTIYFGWHYLLDNLLALPLVWLSVIMARQLAHRHLIQ